MKFIELLRTAFQSLKTNRKRSFLTIIGIMIGIAAVITILGMGDGVKRRCMISLVILNKDNRRQKLDILQQIWAQQYMVLPKKISLILRQNLVQNLKM